MAIIGSEPKVEIELRQLRITERTHNNFKDEESKKRKLLNTVNYQDYQLNTNMGPASSYPWN